MLRGKEAERDLGALKELSKLADKTMYLDKRREIMEKYDVDKATVWRHMNSKNPCRVKPKIRGRNVNRVVTDEEIAKVKELMSEGYKVYEIRQFLEAHFGKSYHDRFWRKLRKRVVETESGAECIGSRVVSKEEHYQTEFGNENPLNPPFVRRGQEQRAKNGSPIRTLGESNLRNLMEEFYGVIDGKSNEGIWVKFGEETFKISNDDCRDVCLILANSYERRKGMNGIHFSREEYLRQKFLHLLQDKLRLAQEFSTTNQLSTLANIFNRIEKINFEVIPNLAILKAVCFELRPEITTEEIYGLVEKYAYLENTEAE